MGVYLHTQTSARTGWEEALCVCQRQPGLLKPKIRETAFMLVTSIQCCQTETSAELVQGLEEFGLVIQGWLFMPPRPLTQGAEGILGACSRSVAWKFWGQASGTAGGDNISIMLEFNIFGFCWKCDFPVCDQISAVKKPFPHLSQHFLKLHTHPAHSAGEH